MAKRASITKATQRRAAADERKHVRAATSDSYQNAILKLGIGTDNPLSGSTYGFNPITRIRTILEWMYRGSWMGGIAVDLVADDMTRAGIEINSNMEPDALEKIKKAEVGLDLWGKINETIKWSRLYGGCIMVAMIDGQDMATPLRTELPLMKGQLKGFLVLDRWMIEARLEQLVNVMGPDLGLPMYYRVNSDAPAFRNQNIHYSRVLRLSGVDLPYWQRVQENLWGLSVFERLYDRMVGLDSSTQGAAQLVYKSFLRTYKMKGMTELMAMGGDQGIATVLKKLDMVRRYQSNEGITLVDAEDDVTVQTSSAFTGISEVILQMVQQISGTLQIPLVRMYGQSPSGLNSTGESDLRMYYDGIAQQQERTLRLPLDWMYRLIAKSEGIDLPPDFNWTFRPLWQLDEGQKSEIAARDASSLAEMQDAGLISTATAMRELKQNSRTTGRFDSITDEDIAAAAAAPPDPLGLPDMGLGDDEIALAGGDPTKHVHGNPSNGSSPLSQLTKPTGDDRRTRDSLPKYHVCGVQVSVENMKGSVRTGPGWSVVMPADYGYIPTVDSAEGDTEWMDAYVGPNRDSEVVWVADMLDPRTGKFDEHKCMLGFDDAKQARECLSLSYNDKAVRRVAGLTKMSAEEFQAWLRSGDHKRPVSKGE